MRRDLLVVAVITVITTIMIIAGRRIKFINDLIFGELYPPGKIDIKVEKIKFI